MFIGSVFDYFGFIVQFECQDLVFYFVELVKEMFELFIYLFFLVCVQLLECIVVFVKDYFYFEVCDNMCDL